MAGSPAAGGSTAAAAAAAAARSRVLINGSPSSLRVLRALAPLLVDVNGQHASLALRDSNQQLQLLDRIAGVYAVGYTQRTAAGQVQNHVVWRWKKCPGSVWCAFSVFELCMQCCCLCWVCTLQHA